MDELLAVARRLSAECDALAFQAPVAYVYNPLDYAWAGYERYLKRAGPAEVVLVGMNPGPFGMAQTGVPFGDVGMVRDWLGIEAEVGQPARLHPKRPVQGFACPRGEVSGRRVWGWARERFGSAEDFLARFFVLNYCPLVFFDADGRNVTPDKLKAADRDALFDVCDCALADMVRLIGPRVVVGIGRFAEQRAQSALREQDVEVVTVTHPSPANPQANKGWSEQMDRVMSNCGIL